MNPEQTSFNAGDQPIRDIVGDRVLVGVQPVDIARLSAHAIPLVSRGLVTVAGQGPKDSNGAGKSSLIAAISLLCADGQWHLTGGGAGAAQLLFTAEVAAQEGRWSNVDRGYVIGVFASPAAATIEELASSVLTVWLRINRKSPYIDVRWCDGLYVPIGSSDLERVSRVDAMWEQLPKRNGRHDIHANRLAETLYGGRVRCVSFLSTSVRAGASPNLIAQPLNELSPDRIFDAIASLTGTDREMDMEKALRTAEHVHRVAVADADADLRRWEDEMEIVASGIEARTKARRDLDQVSQHWRSYCATWVVEGTEQLARLRGDLAASRSEAERARAQQASAEKDRRALLDDEALRQRCEAAEKSSKIIEDACRKLEAQREAAHQSIRDLSGRRDDYLRRARDADGRDLETAQRELERAEAERAETVERRGAARQAMANAEQRLSDAEGGEDVAGMQLRCLLDEGVTCAGLMDVLVIDEEERLVWEPRLLPYDRAVVIHPDDAEKGTNTLAGLPGSMLVLADAGDDPPPDVVHARGGTDGRFSLNGFLSVLAGRGSGADSTDADAGVIVVGGFSAPITGRAARVDAARKALVAERVGLQRAEEEARATEGRGKIASRRRDAAAAAVEADELKVEIERLRQTSRDAEEELERRRPEREGAMARRVEAQAARLNRGERVAALARQIEKLRSDLEDNALAQSRLVNQEAAVDLDARLRAWQGTLDDARQRVDELDEQGRTPSDHWVQRASHGLDEVINQCFASHSGEERPAEIRELVQDPRWRDVVLEGRRELFPMLLQAVRTYLARTEKHDLYQSEQISSQRDTRRRDLEAARQGLNEARTTAEAHRASLSQGIRARLKQVAEEFDRLDQDHGGYGAGLDFPEPEPPAEPDRPWQWSVTPKWRRAEGQRLAPYNLRGNTAQLDEKAVKLLCAAALAGGNDDPLLLVLDELGRNLGNQHRREAVALFEQIGHHRNITVIGALQDDMERYAIDASGLYIRLRRASDNQPYNDPPVIVGYDANAERVTMLQEWFGDRRPPVEVEPGAAG